ncbi:MAG: peptidoglycan bridge formation glycyltransferase FemA/FemB family protein [Sedimentisphaerales bacterium]|nr:peptidoglycan bridge formation glycyltransferase FemA/FemB family protein [Sedimentisphaerales bacterium]
MTHQVIIDDFDSRQWEKYACEFADYSIYQTWAYQQSRADMTGQKVSKVVVRNEKSQIVTMAQVRIKHFKRFGFKIGYIQWGPLVRGKDGSIRCSLEALKELKQAYLDKEVNVLRVVPNVCNDEKGAQISRMLTSGGFGHVRSFSPYRTFLLKVDDSEEGIRKRLRKSFRRDLKKAEKAGIEIREGHDEGFCEILKGLYLTSLERKGFKGLDMQEFVGPQRLLAPAEKMNIIVACFDGEPVSAFLESHLGDTSVVLLAASNEKGLACGASYLIWYRGVVSAFHAGMKWCDLGGIDPDDNPNVYQFKSRMGPEETFHIGAFDACRNFPARAMWHVSEKAYNWFKR